jgi:hypothetical protein
MPKDSKNPKSYKKIASTVDYHSKHYATLKADPLAQQSLDAPKYWKGNAHAHLLNEHTSHRQSLHGTITQKRTTMVPLVVTTIVAIGLGSIGVAKLHEMNLPPIEQSSSKTTPTSKTNSAGTKPAEGQTPMKPNLAAYAIDGTTCAPDSEGRYVIGFDITSNTEGPSDISLDVNLAVMGTNSRSEPWQNTLKTIDCDTITTDVWSHDGHICVANMAPGETRHVTLYPNLTGRAIPDMTIDKVTSADVIVIDAAGIADDKSTRSVNDIEMNAELKDNGNTLHIYGRPKNKQDKDSYEISGILLDVHSEPFGTQTEDGIGFPFGIQTFKVTMSPNEQMQNKFEINCDTEGNAKRAILCGIRRI